jgi:ABC-type glycerol-3-phosphate transport system substrate-binding protein
LAYSNSTDPLDSTSPASSAKSLKESDEISHISNDNGADDDIDRVKREAEEMETTTTIPIETSANEIQDTTLSTTLEIPQKPSQVFMSSDHHKFPYLASSSGINAQHISITQKPPVRNYYDFYPSAPDFYYYNNKYKWKPICMFYDTGFRPVYHATNSYW